MTDELISPHGGVLRVNQASEVEQVELQGMRKDGRAICQSAKKNATIKLSLWMLDITDTSRFSEFCCDLAGLCYYPLVDHSPTRKQEL